MNNVKIFFVLLCFLVLISACSQKINEPLSTNNKISSDDNNMTCKDTTSKSYIAEGKQCTVVDFGCPKGFQPFSDDCGCGCEKIA